MGQKADVRSGWLDTNERLELVNSLKKAHQFILEVHGDLYQWKWVIIALHNSVQASMVLALKGSAAFNVYKKRNKEEWIRAFNSQLEDPQQKFPKKRYLAGFLELYDRIKSEDMNLYVESKIFISSERSNYAMDRLNAYRNEFTHFAPCSWSLQIIGLPEICKEVLSIIEFLIFDSGNIYYYNDLELENLNGLISEIRVNLDELEILYKTS